MTAGPSREERWRLAHVKAKSAPGRYRANAAACAAFAVFSGIASWGRAWWLASAALVVAVLWAWLGASWLAVTWRRESPPGWWLGWVR